VPTNYSVAVAVTVAVASRLRAGKEKEKGKVRGERGHKIDWPNPLHQPSSESFLESFENIS